MGQKANKITLQFLKKQFNIKENNCINLVHILGFLKAFNLYLNTKNINIFNTTYSSCANLAVFNFNIFFLTKKCSVYKKLSTFSTKDIKLKIINKKFIILFNKYFNYYKKNVYRFKFTVLNKNLPSKLILYVKSILFKYKNTIFNRRYTLYIDFIKITVLFYTLKIQASSYLEYLALIFKFLTKKAHSTFFKFLRVLFIKLLLTKYEGVNPIKGLAFKINGKLKGKARATTFKLLVGKMPRQTITANIDFAMCHTYTRLGAFGLHLHVYN
jgi:hypothetical protein